MKTIIVCAAGTIGGKEIVSLELGEGLAANHFNVQFLVSCWGSEQYQKLLEERGIEYRLLPLGFISATLTWQCLGWTFGQIKRWPELMSGYRRLLDRFRPVKILHTNWHHLLLLFPLLKANRDLFWVHEVIPDRWQYRVVFRLLASRLQCFVPVSGVVADSLRQIGVKGSQIKVIRNGLKIPLEANESNAETHHSPKVGIAGQINEDKGHEDLIEAFSRIKTDWPTAELHVFGTGAENFKHYLEVKIRSLGILDNVKWHGFVTDRREIFTHLDICVVPSRNDDPLPTVAIEASSFGLPVVATKRGGLPEIVEDGVTGLLVQAQDPVDLAAGLSRLLADAKLRQAMGARGRSRIIQYFSSERFLKDFRLLLTT